MSESNIMRRIMLSIGKSFPNVRVFRNNVGQAWVGKSKQINGGVFIENARPFHAGLAKGSPDLVGWISLVVTSEMIGQSIAVFTGIETKSKTGRTSPEQRNFLEQIEKNGGIAIVANDEEKIIDTLTARIREITNGTK
jgi:hypothetical protein